MPPVQLATPDDFIGFGSNQELVQNSTRWTTAAITRLMTRATTSVEARCDRRLAPFTGLTESYRAEGVANDSSPNDDVPLDLRSALGRAQSMAFGATALVRDFWLAQYTPVFQDQWSYTLEQIVVVTPYGGALTIPPNQITDGPQPDNGHFRLPLGEFCPPGSTVRITYSGGYTPIPEDLNLACILQATKVVLIGAEPELRKTMSTADLDEEIVTLLVPYIRY